MAIMNRKHSQLPHIEALEDRFLPSATTVLPFSNDVGKAFSTETGSPSKDLDQDNKSAGVSVTSPMSHEEQSRVTDAAFDPSRSGLSEMLAYKPMFAVITYQPGTMQYHETIWFTYVSYKPVVNTVKPKALVNNSISPDSDDVASVVRNVASQTVGTSLAATVRPKDAGVAVVAKDLVDVVMSASTRRATETTATVNLPLTNAGIVTGMMVLPNYSSSPMRALEGQGSAQRPDPSTGDNSETLPPEASRGVTAIPGNESLATAGRLMTEKLGLHTDESSLVFNEIEQALQTLVEPFAANLQSYEPSVLWVFLSTWVAAAGITYEYLRRRVLVHQPVLDVVKDWLPQHLES